MVKWITREQVRIDRVASAWLIKRFVDPQAEFVFVPGPEVLDQAKVLGAIPFHVPGAELGQTSDRTGFDAIVEKYGISDPTIPMMADMVRSADRRGDAAEGPGIRAISHGFAAMGVSDDKVLELEVPIFEALYRYCETRRPQAKRGDSEVQ